MLVFHGPSNLKSISPALSGSSTLVTAERLLTFVFLFSQFHTIYLLTVRKKFISKNLRLSVMTANGQMKFDVGQKTVLFSMGYFERWYP